MAKWTTEMQPKMNGPYSIPHMSMENLAKKIKWNKPKNIRDQMECGFLNRFNSTRQTVSMMELTNTKQWKDESVVDYINHWGSLSLDCKDRLSKVSAMEM